MKKYTVRQHTPHLFSVLEHISHGLYIDHGMMSWLDNYRWLQSQTQATPRAEFVHDTENLIHEKCTSKKCTKTCDGFLTFEAETWLEIGHPFCLLCGLETIANRNYRGQTHAKQ